ncbi:MAG: hypothetical protein NDI61_00420 [Bdellovibrionaceae bacterium]|nr:hypothetical protein [Pseudobdellovibrionaceae bacterium]
MKPQVNSSSLFDIIHARIAAERDQPSREDSFQRFSAAFQEAAFSYLPERVVLVAGTNGKGSVAKSLEVMLRSAGQSVGLFTSPHLIRATERIRCDGRDIRDDEFITAFECVEALVRKHRLSHFETLTLMAAEVFFSGRVRPRVEWAVLEVGVGGRWDPTNAFEHCTSVITPMGLDHVELLGGDLESIASHKLAVIRPGSLVIHAPFPQEALREVARVQAATGGRWIESRPFSYYWDLSGADPRFRLRTPWGEVETDLPGPRAAENLAMAVTAFGALGFVPQDHVSSLARIEWPGRMETFRVPEAACPIHLSGDHNIQGVESLLALLPHYHRETLHWIVAVGVRKQREDMLGLFASVERSELNLTRVPFRGAPLEQYGDWLARARDVDDQPDALLQRVIRRARAGDRIVVSGSLYLVGHLRSALLRMQDQDGPGEQRNPIR